MGLNSAFLGQTTSVPKMHSLANLDQSCYRKRSFYHFTEGKNWSVLQRSQIHFWECTRCKVSVFVPLRCLKGKQIYKERRGNLTETVTCILLARKTKIKNDISGLKQNDGWLIILTAKGKRLLQFQRVLKIFNGDNSAVNYRFPINQTELQGKN